LRTTLKSNAFRANAPLLNAQDLIDSSSEIFRAGTRLRHSLWSILGATPLCLPQAY
jgi:hypothetical protein